MTVQSILIKKLHEQGEVNPIAYLVKLARKHTIPEIQKMMGVSYFVVLKFFKRHNIEVIPAKSTMNKWVGGDALTMFKKDAKTMTVKQIAQKYGIPARSVGVYLSNNDIKAVRPEPHNKKSGADCREDSRNFEPTIKTFNCLGICKKPQPIELMSAKKDVCQRCLKNQIRGRV
jgi:hypothetical protein